MTPINELKLIARGRLEDAKVLLRSRRFDGAAYLCGYAIELILKYRICRTLKWQSFPKANSEFKTKQSLKTHKLEDLLEFSGRESKIKTQFMTEWSLLVDWDPEARYNSMGTVSPADAADMVRAAEVLLNAFLNVNQGFGKPRKSRPRRTLSGYATTPDRPLLLGLPVL
jgi:HEPN domain-containing protein